MKHHQSLVKYWLFLLLMALSSHCHISLASKPDLAMGINAAQDLMQRVLGPGSQQRIELELLPQAGNEREYFILSQRNSKPLIQANSLSALTRGLYQYLRSYAKCHISWTQLHNRLPTTLALPHSAQRYDCHAPMRYYLNYCTYSYSMAFWDWERWEQELDLMALYGINAPLMLVGLDAVWYDILQEMGYSPSEISRFIAGPAYQAWWLMNNLEGWGGPNPKWWYQERRILARRIVERMRELGMQPVLPGYSGMVPSDITDKTQWQVADPGLWCHFRRPAFLLPTDKHFGEMAERYYRHLTALLGKSQYYSMDPFHEGGRTEGIDLASAYKSIHRAMRAVEPTARWVIQSWNENPRAECLRAIPESELIILDLFSDGQPKWQHYGRHDFVYCMLHNFGGRIGLHGRAASTLQGYYQALRERPETCIGIGATPEGIEQNPMLYDLLYSMAWGDSISLDSYLPEHLDARYQGQNNKALTQAWEIILRTAYACPTRQQGTSEAVYLARPSLDVRSVSTWSSSKLYYQPQELEHALGLMLEGAPRSADPNYDYDLVDLCRQVLADRAALLLPQIKQAWTAGDSISFRRQYQHFLGIILDTDRLLGTQSVFRLGKWLEDARALGNSARDKRWLEYNARMLITTWGYRPSANEGGLRDYANRTWSGLLRDYYYPRWQSFFHHLDKGTALPDWYASEAAWTQNYNLRYKAKAEGDSRSVVRELWHKYQLGH